MSETIDSLPVVWVKARLHENSSKDAVYIVDKDGEYRYTFWAEDVEIRPGSSPGTRTEGDER